MRCPPYNTQRMKREFQKDSDNLEEIVESLTNEENVNIFLARQRLRFIKENLNSQEMKDSIYLNLHIAAHNIDGIASTPSIQKLHSLLEFIEENNIDIIAISETNIDYRQEYFINLIIFSERDQKIKGSGMLNFYSYREKYGYGDFNDIIDNKIDHLPSTEQPGSQFLIQLSQLELYDICRALYLDTELFTHEKWDKNKDKSSPISRSRIDQIWITHEADVIPVEFSVHSSQMITNSHHSIISTTINISGFIKNNFRHCVLDQIRDLNLDDRNQNNRIVDISKITNLQWENFTEILDREIETWDFQQLIDEFNNEIQLGYETNNDEEKIRYKFNEIWNNIMSAISIVDIHNFP
ncbi:hypothetical protein C1646_764929 [Rhizophagus diaphanus]|nr:hypothetical protein C1646_764929 [Rhizophagus diaphanus] [Rhizophagus sp. MUCL 43196]